MLERVSDRTARLAMGLSLAMATVCSVTTLNAQQSAASKLITEADTETHYTKHIKPLPYLMVQEESIHHPDGTIVNDQDQLAAWERITGQREDGARVYVYWGKSYPEKAQRSVHFPDKGIIIDVNGLNDNKSTSGTGTPQDLARERKLINFDTCGTNHILVGQDTIQGFKTFHTRQTKDGRTVERWYSPDLDCMEVRTIEKSSNGFYTSIEPLSLSNKAPDEKYFAIRDGLKEVDPITFLTSIAPQTFPPGLAEKRVREYEEDKAAREKRKGE
jgi:hypothetical protein